MTVFYDQRRFDPLENVHSAKNKVDIFALWVCERLIIIEISRPYSLLQQLSFYFLELKVFYYKGQCEKQNQSNARLHLITRELTSTVLLVS